MHSHRGTNNLPSRSRVGTLTAVECLVSILGVASWHDQASAASWWNTCATGRLCFWGSTTIGNSPVAAINGSSSDGDSNFSDNNLRNSDGTVNRVLDEGVGSWQNKFSAGGASARAYYGHGYTNQSPTYCITPGSSVGPYVILSSGTYSSTAGMSSVGWGALVGC